MSRTAGRTVVFAVGLFVVLLWVSTSGSTPVWHAPPAGPPQAPRPGIDPLPTTVAGVPATPPDLPATTDEKVSRVIETVLLALLIVAIAGCAYLLRGMWKLKWRRPPREDDLPSLLPDIATAVTQDADAQLAALAHGSPRNAIVACWVRLEDAVASAGLPPDPAETSAELTGRVLAAYAVDERAIAELAALYREARFSSHELGEAERDQALDALRRLHADLGRRHAEAGAT